MSDIVKCASCGTKNRIPAVPKGKVRCASCHRDLPWLVNATSSDFDQAISTSLPVLVDLWAPWCGPCKMVAPAIERASVDFAGQLKVVKVNVDVAPEVSARFAVQGIPTLLFLRDGRLVDQQVGALPEHQLIAWTRANLGL